MESQLQFGNPLKLNKNLQKIYDYLSKVEGVKSLIINENENENKENVKIDQSLAEEEVIGEQAMNSIHLPYKHFAMTSGKNLRSKLLKALNHWFNVEFENKDQEILTDVIAETLQNVALLIDDIQDNSTLRRGLPCAHLIYGVPATINSAIYYMFILLQLIVQYTPKDHMYAMMTELFNLTMDALRGQQMEIHWRENLIVPTLEEYKKMVDLKSTSLFRLLCLLMKKPNSELNLDRFCYLLGQFFQIRDDYINLTNEEYQKLKGFAEDLTEGKFSFPIIHGIRKDPKDSTILSILKMHTENVELKQMVINKLEGLGSFEYTKNYLDELESELLAELAKLPVNPFISEVLKPILFNYIA